MAPGFKFAARGSRLKYAASGVCRSSAAGVGPDAIEVATGVAPSAVAVVTQDIGFSKVQEIKITS
jgi:hypothetical protein